mmetsp:Transcript_44221/g.53438  ORF Transcript_44221/g.53438 Transcript_44221/m.53438 type:complete len:85 (+) Transcript_44221:91-345(+)
MNDNVTTPVTKSYALAAGNVAVHDTADGLTYHHVLTSQAFVDIATTKNQCNDDATRNNVLTKAGADNNDAMKDNDVTMTTTANQ